MRHRTQLWLTPSGNKQLEERETHTHSKHPKGIVELLDLPHLKHYLSSFVYEPILCFLLNLVCCIPLTSESSHYKVCVHPDLLFPTLNIPNSFDVRDGF